MRYLFAFIIPPLAIALCGRWVHFVINLVFSILAILMIPILGIGIVMWFLCTIHALSVCRISSVDKRVDRIVQAIQTQKGPAAGE
jgi:uncharacterized membrane protein YqaE (UPF0057 family)